MIEVVGVSFSGSSKIYYFSPNGYKIKKGINVIVRTERGLQFGTVELENTKIEEHKIKSALNEVIRISSKKDYEKHLKNIEDAKKAIKKCKELVENNKLNMMILDANYTFDKSQLLFTFLADNRVDFRKLAKDLANIYKTRIELRQVGVRDKAKEVGGYGCCGRPLCCSKFLSDFDSVSINMAKNQNIALNPTKINGVCGRLLCCLKYEDECYKECAKKLPKVGKKVQTEFGEGKVISTEILKQTYRVDVKDHGIVEVSVNEGN
jgi:cell fate regulator YaaT (PSP1 superfamily)